MKTFPKLLSLTVAGLMIQQASATDLVLLNGKIFTADSKNEQVQALAVDGGKIEAVGSDSQIKKLIDKDTKVIDLKGQRVLPGFIDAHSHGVLGGVQLGSADIKDEVLTIDQLEANINRFKQNESMLRSGVLKVMGVNGATWTETNELHKRFNAGEWKTAPLALMASDYHTGWANDVLLKKAGITKEMIAGLPKTEQGVYGRFEDGTPNGFLVDAAWDKVNSILPEFTQQEIMNAAEHAVKYNHSFGITAWMDPTANATPSDSIFSMNPTEKTVGVLPGYKGLADQGKLKAHVAGLLVANSKSTPADLVALDKVRKQFQGVENLTIPGIKIFADGILRYPMQSAAVLTPYKNSGKRGELLFNEKDFAEFVTAADKEGWIVHVHAIGDRAVQETLNAVEAARKANKNAKIPHSITHMQLVSESDIPRFKELNVIADMQLAWAGADEYRIPPVKPYIDAKAFELMYPAKSLQNAGAIIASSSDWPDSPPNPWLTVQKGITRDGPYGVLNAKESLTLKDMLYSYTINAAKAIGLEQKIGSLQKGKQADFIVVDRDVFKTPVNELNQTQVLETYFDGDLVYSK
jgi:predicted amidohydrolase YtcJ